MEDLARLWPRLGFRIAGRNGIPTHAGTIQDEARVLEDAADESPGINLLLTITPQHCLH
jgi:hypothetical protein